MDRSIWRREMKKQARILLAAPKSGSGKTLFTCGLLALCKKKQIKAAAMKCGPDYIDPMFHRKVLKVPSGNLDSYFTDEDTLRGILTDKMEQSDLTVIEGVMGFYDGLSGISEKASTYDVARLTKTPVLLVVDGKGASVSLAALIRGIRDYREDSHIAGVLLNRVSPAYYERIKAVIEKECELPVLGYLPELPPVYTDMTVLEYLKFVAELKKIPKDQRKKQILEVMNLVKITDMQNRLIKNLSKGYRQRVGLAQAVLGYPPIIILDEPTVGLDPKQIIEIRDLIKSLGKKHTVILSSHILSEVSAVCDYVMIIAKGQLVASDTPENLSKLMLGSNTVTCTVHGTRKQLVPALNALDAKEIQYENTPNEEQIKVKITTEKDKDIREELFYALAKANCPILELTSSSMSLEDVFLELTDDSGKAARKLKKAEKEQLKQKECEKECEPEADKTAVGETSEEKSTDAAESAAETKQEEGDAQ